MSKERREFHHVLPLHDSERKSRKTIPLTLPEHAFVHGVRFDHHRQIADKWAEKAIMKRMNIEELDQYIVMLREGRMYDGNRA